MPDSSPSNALASLTSQSAIQSLVTFLSGKKTYFTAGALALYFAGGGLKWWPLNPEAIGLLSTLSIVTLRAAVAKVQASADAPVVIPNPNPPTQVQAQPPQAQAQGGAQA